MNDTPFELYLMAFGISLSLVGLSFLVWAIWGAFG